MGDVVSVLDLLAEHEAKGLVPAAPPRRVALAEYVRAVKRIELDPWQVDMCERLERVFWLSQADKFESEIQFIDGSYVMPSGLKIEKEDYEGHRNRGTNVAIAAPPQFGKSIIVSQCYPAWILGYDPLHRFRLATYNIQHSKRFSGAIRRDMRSAEHRAFFPNPMGFVNPRSPSPEWSTDARLLGVNDGQPSFIALGLETGFVGTGVDTLLMDDPYASAEKALSPTVRDVSWRFYTDTAMPRCNDRTNTLIMYHRYHQDDVGGRALADIDLNFDLWRYAAQFDDEWQEDTTGRKFQCYPPFHKKGDYLTTREGFTDRYYERQKRNDPIWQAQFQGRPTAKAGNMFDVLLIREIDECNMPDLLFEVRAWDNAATEGAGAFSAGVRLGVDAAENIYMRDIKREQVGTAERKLLQHSTAIEDGKLVPIHYPQDPGSAGKDVAFEFKQEMEKEEYNVTVTKVTGIKELRAYNSSKAVNEGRVYAVRSRRMVRGQDGECFEVEADQPARTGHYEFAWDFNEFKKEAKYFPASTYKDQIDAFADAYNYLMTMFHRGLVVKAHSRTNLLHWSRFESRFGDRIPAHWEVDAAIRISSDSSHPSGYTIVAHAAENARLGEALFVVAASRRYVSDPSVILQDLKAALVRTCARGIHHPSVIWVNKGSAEITSVAAEKAQLYVSEFKDDSSAGIPETNFYFQTFKKPSPWYQNIAGDGPRMATAHLHLLVADKQYDEPVNDLGMLSVRQDLASWSYGDKGEVQTMAGITLDCVRMCLYKFALSATGLTVQEQRESQLPESAREENVRALLHTPQFTEALYAREREINKLRMQDEEEYLKPARLRNHRNNPRHGTFGRQAVLRRHRSVG